MKKITITLALVIGLAAGTAFTVSCKKTATAEASKPSAWEITCVSNPERDKSVEKMIKEVNVLAAKGWEPSFTVGGDFICMKRSK